VRVHWACRSSYRLQVLQFPITTDRLTLVPLGADDRDAFVAYRQDPSVARWQGWTPSYSAADADELIAAQPADAVSASGDWLQIAIRAAPGVLLGDVAVHALDDQPDTYELGVTLAPASRGSGIATEALTALVDALFAGGAHRIIAMTDARNEPVARLFARLGFRHEGRAVDADWFKDEWTSVDTWALLAGPGDDSPVA
jgi:RimJ/RimL family protein N-acetyltransferase